MLTSIEICAGAGGQALGLAMAGFCHVALVEYEKEYCEALKRNRPEWNVVCKDLRNFSGVDYRGKIDLLAGGVPCPPFSVAGKQLGSQDERDLFPDAIRLIGEIRPRAVMLENVRGLLDPVFDEYRKNLLKQIENLGYKVQIKLLNANDYGVPQLRPRVIIVGIKNDEKSLLSTVQNLPQKDPKRNFDEAQRQVIYRRDHGICQMCGIHCDWNNWEADHKIPWSKGGATKIENGQVLCPSCNSKKSDQL